MLLSLFFAITFQPEFDKGNKDPVPTYLRDSRVVIKNLYDTPTNKQPTKPADVDVVPIGKLE